MRALVKAESAEGLWLQNVPEPAMGADDVMIRIAKTGICGTDLHIWTWDRWAQRTVPVPLIIGHEFVGEIVAVGDNVRHLEPGQRVTGEGHVTGTRSRAARAVGSTTIPTRRASASTCRGPSPSSSPCLPSTSSRCRTRSTTRSAPFSTLWATPCMPPCPSI